MTLLMMNDLTFVSFLEYAIILFRKFEETIRFRISNYFAIIASDLSICYQTFFRLIGRFIGSNIVFLYLFLYT